MSQKIYIKVNVRSIVEVQGRLFAKWNWKIFYHPDCDILIEGYDAKRHEQIAHVVMIALQSRNLSASALRYNKKESASKPSKVSPKQKLLF